MAAGYLVVARLGSSSGIPADDIVNTFAFIGGAPPPDDVSATAMMDEFYNTDSSGVHALCESISVQVSRVPNSSRVLVYDLEDPEPRTPLVDAPWTLGNPASDECLPNEVAVCLSFSAAVASGEPAARSRGRVYIGPLIPAVVEDGGTSQARVEDAFMADLIAAGQRMWDMAAGAWGVYSRADDVVRPVLRGWVDNEFDTQRRRGRRATNRLQRDFTS